MTTIFFEEFVGTCENDCVSTCGKCKNKGRLRRMMSSEYGLIGTAYCDTCMPDYFVNVKNYPVFIGVKSKLKDPLYESYVKFYNKRFTTEGRKRINEC